MKVYRDSVGAGPDLVLLHGWGMNAAVWSGVRDRLTRRHRVTVIELPGHGASSYQAQCGELDDWTEACLRAAPPRADWIGWSLGGQLALRGALLHPERVGKLLMVASSPRFVRGRDWPQAVPEHTLRQFAETLTKNPGQTLSRFLSLQVRGDDQARRTLRLLRQETELRPAPQAQALQHGLDLLLRVDLRGQLKALQCPSLWLLGERDTLVPAAVRGDLQRLLGSAGEVRVLDGCAHAPFLSHPAQSLAAVEGFLGDGDG